jgi:Ca2+-binding EF-hand superfamily protein
MDRSEVKKIIDSYDQNGDGRVDREEFKHFMTEIMKKELLEQ